MRKLAFTLIELLVTASIVMVLAAIGVASFSAAMVRAKVSRVKSDMRTLTTAIELYHTDSNNYPRMAHWGFYKNEEFDLMFGSPVNGVHSKVISTPVAYMGNAYIVDPFVTDMLNVPIDERLYTYQVISEYEVNNPQSKFWPQALSFYGFWRMASIGPDQSFDHLFANSAQLPYDPTNGINSLGNIWTSQLSRTELPAIPALLGNH